MRGAKNIQQCCCAQSGWAQTWLVSFKTEAWKQSNRDRSGWGYQRALRGVQEASVSGLTRRAPLKRLAQIIVAHVFDARLVK
jgi:hypothetical protein